MSDRTQREVMLADLVGLAHWTRATSLARQYAARFKVPVYIFRQWKRKGYAGGFCVDVVRPTVLDYWRVTPDGRIEDVKAGK